MIVEGLCSFSDKSIVKDSLPTLNGQIQTEHLQNIFTMHYIYTFQVYLWKASQRLSTFIKRNHVSIWNWIQRYRPMKIMQRSKRITEFIRDGNSYQSGHEYMWLWIAIEPIDKTMLGMFVSR